MLMNNSHDRYSDIDCITWTCLHCVQDERKMRLRLVEEAISLIASSSLPKASGQRLWTYGAHSFYTQGKIFDLLMVEFCVYDSAYKTPLYP